MRKFDVRFKGKVVRESLAGKGRYKLLAAKFSIAENMVRRRVAAYCSGQLVPDTWLSFSSATAGATPLLN